MEKSSEVYFQLASQQIYSTSVKRADETASIEGTCEEAIAKPWPRSTRPPRSLISICLGLRSNLQSIHSDSEDGRKHRH